MVKKIVLVEFKDGSFQWLEASSEKEIFSNEQVKRICAELYGRSKIMSSKRWRIGKSQFEKILIN